MASDKSETMNNNNSSEYNSEQFGERVAAVAALVKTYQESGVADFRTLVTRMAERFPEKFGDMKPLLPDIWNAVAHAYGLPRVSDEAVREIYESTVSNTSILQSDCLYDWEERIKHHREWLEEWKRKKQEQISHAQPIQDRPTDSEKFKAIAKTILRMIGAVVIPFVAAWAILLVVKIFVVMGQWSTNEYSDFPMTPWKAFVVLAIGEALAGYTVAYVAYEFAPKVKFFMSIFVVLLYASLLGYFIQHFFDIAVGMIGATVFLVRIYRKN